MSVIIETSIGDITVDLFIDARPRCCLNFLKLCKIKYYNFSLFHTVQQNLVAQTGDPTATGRGGDSIFGHLYGDQARFFEMEIVPRILHSKRGLLSMVNNGSGMHGSQFFITLADNVDYLNNKHTVFGEIAEGMDIVDKLNNTFCDENNRPHQDIRIYHTIILDDPFDDPDSLIIPSESPPPTQEMLDTDHIPCDAEIEDEDGMSEQQLAEMAAEREAKADTQILEMVGDLPDQDVAPPENVLFVCKLNPVTTSDDLEIIFSRFGNIVSCEVIKDQKTGESLQYAFVEFEKQENCEMAYFKMDNVLIDDRRIHVDFSQSVSKLKWKGKGKGVEVMPEGDIPKYVLKNQERQSHGYDLVYSEQVLDVPRKKQAKSNKKHKKEKKSKREESTSPLPKSKKDIRNSRRDDKSYQSHRNRSESIEKDDCRRRDRSKSFEKNDRKRRERSESVEKKDCRRRKRSESVEKNYRKKRDRSENVDKNYGRRRDRSESVEKNDSRRRERRESVEKKDPWRRKRSESVEKNYLRRRDRSESVEKNDHRDRDKRTSQNKKDDRKNYRSKDDKHSEKGRKTYKSSHHRSRKRYSSDYESD